MSETGRGRGLFKTTLTLAIGASVVIGMENGGAEAIATNVPVSMGLPGVAGDYFRNAIPEGYDTGSGHTEAVGPIGPVGDITSTETGRAVPRSEGVFRIGCDFVGSSKNDPIKFPGQPDAAHMHDFYGARGVNAFTTIDTLLGGEGACKDPLADSAYWHPSIIDPDKGKLNYIQPSGVLVYYQYGDKDNTPMVQQIPEGLMMIVGNAMNTEPLNTEYLFFQCARNDSEGEIEKTERSTQLPVCKDSEVLTAVANFPSCWDGVNLDSADHISHMAYPVMKDCPPTHPVPLAQIHARFRWGGFSGTNDAYLSSDPMTAAAERNKGRSWHVDLFEALNESRAKKLFEVCLRGSLGCKSGADAEDPQDINKQPVPEGTLPGPYPRGIYPPLAAPTTPPMH